MDPKDNNAVAQNAPETTGQTKSPQVEAPTTETQTPKDIANPEGELNEPKFQSDEERRAFQEQRLEIKRLKEEKAARLKSESAFASFRQPVAPQANLVVQNVRTEDYTDPMTGELNRPAYNAAVQSEAARQTALMAQQSVQEQIDEYNARQKHPELFSDPEIEEEIASRWFFNKYQGKNVSLTEIADAYAKKLGKAVSKAEKIGAEKALEEVSPKEQAALSASSQTSAPSRLSQSDEEFEKLRLLSRGGRLSSDTESSMAIAQRMKNVPWANK